jgi:tryptophan halogenase
MNSVKTVVVVGGGSSSWLTVALLSKKCPHIKFTVVDKEIGNPIGVGEGTLLSFSSYMQDCGFAKSDWFNKIDATYKAGVLFPDWVRKGENIWHPFMMSPILDNGVSLHAAWSNNQEYSFKDYGLCLYDISVNHNSIDSSVIDSYAYHVDCGKLVQFIQQNIKDRISFVASDVVEVIKNGDKITSLKLADGSLVHGDLFIDCTGFKSLLRPEAERVELMGRVFCDTAVCGQIQYEDIHNEMRPYTKAQAVDHGWIWTIPTQSRMGSGIIFNKGVTDIEEAKDYFVNYWGGRISKDKLRVIDWTPYYLKDAWEGNVISVGMSSGFIEPLESTGLALVQYQANAIYNVIKAGFYKEENVTLFNIDFRMRFEDCVDFVSAHYSKTERTEKFWKYVNDTYKHTPGISFMLSLLEESPRYGTQYQYNHIFTGTNWTTWMQQMGYPIGSDLNVTPDYAKYVMLKHHDTVEVYRKNWSQHNYTEIERSNKFDSYNLN